MDNVSQVKPTIWIGKNGISENILKNIAIQLNKNKIVKIKIQKSCKDNFFIDIFLEKLKNIIKDVKILDQRGRTITLGLNR